MKSFLLYTLLSFIAIVNLNAQTIFWTENFGLDPGTCSNQNQNANGATTSNGIWSQTIIAAEGAQANIWYISATEAGMGAGACGDGCLATSSLDNQTLHLGSVGVGLCPTGDCGASYNAGSTGETHKRIESPIIDCSGRSSITLSFEYMHFGEAGLDQGSIWYFDGVSWNPMPNPLHQVACCGGPCGNVFAQGKWSTLPFSEVLPSSADNNPNVRIGFQWDNDANNTGSDPSFAIDKINLSGISVGCPNTGIPPVAVCQPHTVYLDGTGNGNLIANDIDGGSTDDCGIVFYTASQTAFTCNDIGTSANMVITSVYDGPLPGGLPKGVELYVISNIPDLSLYGVGSANNGGGTDGEEFSFPSVSVSAGTFIYLATDSASFNDWYGFNADYINGVATNINGDDAIELFFNGGVIDVFGDINIDGTGQPWEYLDGWAYRNSGTGPDGTTFVLGSWYFSGINALDTETSNGTASVPVPVSTYSVFGGGVSVDLIVQDAELLSDTCSVLVTVLDTIPPTVVCQTISVYLDGTGNANIIADSLNGGSTDNCNSLDFTASQLVFTCANLGTNLVTLYATDASTNIDSCDATVIVIDTLTPTISCLDDTLYLDGIGLAILNPNDIDGGSTDNCGTVNLSTSIQTFTCNDLGSNTVTLYGNDVSGNMDSCTAIITVLDTVIPTISCPLDIDVCEGDIVSFSTPTGADNCTVSTVNQTDGSGLSSGMIFPLGPTTIQFTVEDINGLKDSCTFDVIVNSVDTSVLVNGTDTLSSNASGATYQWLDCNTGNSIIVGATNQSYIASASGSFSVQVTQNGCIDTSSCYSVLITGLKNSISNSEWSIYPNPIDDNVVLIFGKVIDKINVNIVDIRGKEVYTTNNFNKNKIEVDTKYFNSGVYFVRITSDKYQKVIKLIKK